MAALLKINGNDYSAYLDITDEGFDPVNSDRISPQFGGSLAFNEGQPYVRDSAGNREWHLPLKLKAATTDALFALVRQLKLDLKRANTFEYKPDGASQSTFFDLERGKVDEQYQHFLQRAGWLRCTVKAWTRPHGHTGTTRLIASAAGTGPMQVSLPSMAGDINAQALLSVGMGSTVATSGRLLMWGVHCHPSWIGIYPAASLIAASAIAGASVSLVGASGAIGSQYAALWSASGVNDTLQIGLPLRIAVQGGRHRVIAVARHKYLTATAVLMQARNAATAVATQNNGPWQMLDLGEVNVMSGDPGVATYSLLVTMQGPFGAIANLGFSGTPQLHFNALMLVPLETAAGALRAGSGPFQAVNKGGLVPVVQTIGSQSVWFASTGLAPLEQASVVVTGNGPEIPGVTGPAQLIVFEGDPAMYTGNAQLKPSVSARERFSFFR